MVVVVLFRVWVDISDWGFEDGVIIFVVDKIVEKIEVDRFMDGFFFG